MKSILDEDFEYVPSHKTDLKKRFAQIRKQLRKDAEAKTLAGAVVRPIKKEQK